MGQTAPSEDEGSRFPDGNGHPDEKRDSSPHLECSERPMLWLRMTLNYSTGKNCGKYSLFAGSISSNNALATS
jgi:hypothetical protein